MSQRSLLTVSLAVTVLLVPMSAVTSDLEDTPYLLCYQCGSTSNNVDSPNSCLNDYSGLLNTSKGESNIYEKNCTAAVNKNWTMCYIRSIEDRGKLTLYDRGCHDGKTFDHNQDSQRFHVHVTNTTTCDMFDFRLVCYRFCTGNYCNGPQLSTNTCTYNNETDTYEECLASSLGPLSWYIFIIITIYALLFDWLDKLHKVIV